MSKLQQFYTPLDRNRCRCNRCGTELSTNAFARFKHEEKFHSSPTGRIAEEWNINRYKVKPSDIDPNIAFKKKMPPSAAATVDYTSIERRAIAMFDAERECEDCIGMKDHGCYCASVGAAAPGGPLAGQEPGQQSIPCRIDYGNLTRADNIKFKPLTWYPAGQMPEQLDVGPIPEFLKR